MLNAELEIPKLNTLTQTTVRIIDFYENILKTPYGKSVVYISSTPVSKKNEWMFVTYPTIVMVGIDEYKLDNYFDDQTYQFKRKSIITFIAHELAHYYIGTKFVPNGELRWFFLEGLTDYLSIKAAKELPGEEVYQIIVDNYTMDLQNFEPIPLSQINNPNQINETYRYKYAPLLLLAFEQEIGEEKMYQWVSNLLNAEHQKTDYAFFIRSFRDLGLNERQIEELTENYIDHENSKENILNKVRQK